MGGRALCGVPPPAPRYMAASVSVSSFMSTMSAAAVDAAELLVDDACETAR